MDIDLERIIISSLLKNQLYREKVLPYLIPEYFQDLTDKSLFTTICQHLDKYREVPNKVQLFIELQDSSLDQTELNGVVEELWSIEPIDDIKYLVDKTEAFCQNQAIYIAIMKSIAIYDGSEKKLSAQSIPDMVKSAVSVSFDTEIGMDFADDAEKRFEYYTNPEFKTPFKLTTLNEITGGGLPARTLSVVLGATGAGKSMFFIALTADYIRLGYDVLYISMEMREEEILRRVDANLLNVTIADVGMLEKDFYMNKIDLIKKKSYGKLKVKEYPPCSAHCGHFKHLLNELKSKKNFTPKILIIDYLGIIDSSRIKVGSQGSYFYLKAAAEEMRALAVESDVVCITGQQLNRTGASSSDFELSDISESAGISFTADLVLGLIRTPELDAAGQVVLKQLKNRFGNKSHKSKFVVGCDPEKQTFYDVKSSVQDEIVVPEETLKKLTSGTSIKDRFRMLNA